jgi:hypothetical protein
MFADGESVAGGRMTKGPIISIALVVLVIILGATALVFTLKPASTAGAPDKEQPAAASPTDTPFLSMEARAALSEFIQAQGLNCPSVIDGTPRGEERGGQVIRVRCDNDLNFKVTVRSQSAMMFTVAPWH